MPWPCWNVTPKARCLTPVSGTRWHELRGLSGAFAGLWTARHTSGTVSDTWSEGFDRRELLVRGGRVAVGAGAVVALPGWITVGARSTVDARLVELDQLVQGTVVTPQDSAYDSARRLYSPRYDGVRPGAIVFCETARDVWRTVRWSRRHSIRVVARSGGHSYAGYSTCRGVVVDVTRMNRITVNHAMGTATIGAGARLIDVDEALFEQGVMIPAGSCPSVGIAGLTRGFRAAMAPYVSGQAYQNYIDPELEHPNIAYYATNLPRLRTTKARYDQKNVFRFPRSVQHAPA